MIAETVWGFAQKDFAAKILNFGLARISPRVRRFVREIGRVK